MRKAALVMLKFVPVVYALCCALNSTLSYFGIDLAWIGFIANMMLFVGWLTLAYCFRFCSFYYALILYILTANGLNTIDYLFGIPVSDRGLFILHCGLIGLTILCCTYLHVRDTKKLKKHLTGVG